MSQYQQAAGRIRWGILIAGALLWLIGIFWVFNIAWPGWKIFPGSFPTGAGLEGVMGLAWYHRWSYASFAAGWLGVFLISQWFFLRPRGDWRIGLDKTGRPLPLAVWIAALLAALLSVGLLAAVMELFGVWQRLVIVKGFDSAHDPELRYWPALLALGLLWVMWAVVFLLYWRSGNRGTQLQRLLKGLVGGSLLELLVAAPVHVLILRAKNKNTCYCETGSYTALVLGGTVLLWTFGPGVVLLFLREARRRRPLLDGDTGAISG